MNYLILGIVLIAIFGILCYVVAKPPRRSVFWRIVVSLLILAMFVGGLLLLAKFITTIPGVFTAVKEFPVITEKEYPLVEATAIPLVQPLVCPIVEAPVAPVVEAPVAPLVVITACDPSTVPFADMGELNKYVVTTINGPAIYEWWTGGTNEGVQRVDVGHTITIHGVAGHYWTLPSQQGLDCAWSLHVFNYSVKPQHAGKTYEQLVVPPPAEFLTK